MICHWLLLGLMLGSPPSPDDSDALAEILGRRIIDEKLPLLEVQNFTEGRVPAMPEVNSVEDWQAHADPAVGRFS